MKQWLVVKFAFLVFLSIMTAAALVGGNFYYRIHEFVSEYLNGLPGSEEILYSMNQIFYSQIVSLVVVAGGLSLIVSFIFVKYAGKLKKAGKKEVSK